MNNFYIDATTGKTLTTKELVSRFSLDMRLLFQPEIDETDETV